MRQFLVLSETDVQSSLGVLSEAWAGSRTFVLLPERLPVDSDWVRRSLLLIPGSLRSHHYILLTSGSTGLPKLVLGQRARSEELAACLHNCQSSGGVQETIVSLPLSYSYAFVNQWVWSQYSGRRLRLTRGLKDPVELLSALRSARDAMLCLVGVQVPLLAQYSQGESFPGVIRVHFAGGRFPQESLPTVRTLFPKATIFNNYGCAEAMPRLTLRTAEEADEPANVGRPLPGVELKANEANEMLFRSRYGAVGMVEAGEYTPIAPGDWVKSGDLAQPDGTGSWRLLGRAGEVFKRNGEKISLSSLLGTVFQSWPGQAVFFRERDRRGEEGHVLILAPTPSAGQLKDLLLSFRRYHSRSQWPLRVESCDRIPALANGKPDIRAAAETKAKCVLWRQPV